MGAQGPRPRCWPSSAAEDAEEGHEVQAELGGAGEADVDAEVEREVPSARGGG